MDKKQILATVILIAACLVLLFFAPKPTGLISLQEKPAIKLGAILPLSGKTAYIGQDMRQGIDLAVQEINAKGGIGGRQLEIIFEDSAGDPKLALSAFNKLKIQNVDLFITTLSHVTLALAPLAEESKSPMFTIAVAPSILDAGKFTFVNNFNGAQELGFLVDFIAYEFEYKKLAIIAQNVEFGVQYKDVLEGEWQEAGGSITAVELFESSATDYKTQLMKIKEAEPDFIYVVGYNPHIIRVLTQARELGIEKSFFSYWGAQEKKLLENARETAEGLIFPSSPFSKQTAPQFFAKYEANYGREPHYRAGLAYDIIGMLTEALQKCNADQHNTTCIRDKIHEIQDYPGVTGSTSITEKGGTTKEIVIWKVQNGEFVLFNKV